MRALDPSSAMISIVRTSWLSSLAILACTSDPGGVPIPDASAEVDAAQTTSWSLQFEFQPAAYLAEHELPGARGIFDEGGPQIAVWLETPDGSFVADLFVTERTALRGLGNRPGNGMFVSSPKFS